MKDTNILQILTFFIENKGEDFEETHEPNFDSEISN